MFFFLLAISVVPKTKKLIPNKNKKHLNSNFWRPERKDLTRYVASAVMDRVTFLFVSGVVIIS